MTSQHKEETQQIGELPIQFKHGFGGQLGGGGERNIKPKWVAMGSKPFICPAPSAPPHTRHVQQTQYSTHSEGQLRVDVAAAVRHSAELRGRPTGRRGGALPGAAAQPEDGREEDEDDEAGDAEEDGQDQHHVTVVVR